jgi:lysophospholipase L1-like esterase
MNVHGTTRLKEIKLVAWYLAFLVGLYLTSAAAAQGLEAFWNFDEGSGSLLQDSSGWQHAGSIQGPEWTSGKSGMALSFDGVDDYVEVPDSASFQLISKTITARVLPAEQLSDGWHCILEYGRGTRNWYGLWLNASQNCFHFRWSDRRAVDFKTKLVAGTWYDLAAVLDTDSTPATVKLYLNGTLDQEIALTTLPTQAAGSLSIGQIDGGGEFFRGLVDEIRLYSSPLSATDIQTIASQPSNNQAPVAEPDTVGTPEDQAITIAILENDHDQDNDALRIVTLESPLNGAAVLQGDQVLYTPTANFNGTDSFSYTISDGAGGLASASINVTVEAVNDPPTAADDMGESEQPDFVELDVTENDEDLDQDSLTIQSVSQGQNGTVEIVNNHVLYFPDPDFTGLDSFTYTVSDGQGGLATASVWITVNASHLKGQWSFDAEPEALAIDNSVYGNDGLISEAVHIAGRFGNALSFDTSLTNVRVADSPSLRLNSMTLSAWVFYPETIPAGWRTILEHGRDTHNWYGLWKSGNSDTFHFRWSSRGAADFATPVSAGSWYHVAAVLDSSSSPATVRLFLNGELDSSQTTTLLPVPAIGELSLGSNNLAGEGLGGVLDEVAIYDRALSQEEIRELFQLNANEPPVCQDLTQTTAEDVPASFTLPASDPENDSLTYLILSEGTSGTVDLLDPQTGEVTYTPAADVHGTDSFRFKVSDGVSLSEAATVSLTIDSVDDPPVATDDLRTTNQDTPALINVLENDHDADNEPLQVIAVGQPENGTASISDEQISYTPNSGFAGTDRFSYTIADPAGNQSQASVAITVIRFNHAPVATADTAQTFEDTPVELDVLANDHDPDNDSFTITATTSPVHGLVSLDSNRLRYSPNADFNGSDSFSYTIVDSLGATGENSVTLEVTPVNDAPTAGDDTATTSESVSVEIDVLANDLDPDEDALQLESVTQPEHGSVTLKDALLHYTPEPGFSGSDSFTYTIADPEGATASAGVSVLVANWSTVGHWTLDEGTGDQADDSSDYAQNATRHGAAWTAGVLGNALDFDGVDDYLSVEAPSNLALGSMTLSAWVYLRELNSTGWKTILEYGRSSRNWYGLWKSGNGKRFHFRWALGDALDFSTEIEAKVWYHVAAVLDTSTVPATVSLYLNGVLESTTTSTALPRARLGSFYIGGNPDSGEFFPGVIDNVQILNQALLPVQVASLAKLPDTNVPPSVSDFSFTTVEDTSHTDTLTATDPDDQLLVYSITIPPSKGTIAIGNPVTGDFVYTPLPDISGEDEFTFQAYDGRNYSSPCTVSIQITPQADAATAVDDVVSVEEDHSITIPVLANDVDPDGGTITLLAVTPGKNGTSSIVDNQVVYTPKNNFNGEEQLTYTIQDSTGLPSRANIAITVVPVNDPPAAVDDSALTSSDAAVTIAPLENDTDPEADSLSLLSTAAPSHGQLVTDHNNLIYIPEAGFSGTDTFAYTVSDSHGATDTAYITVTVSIPDLLVHLALDSITDNLALDDGPYALNATVQGASLTSGILGGALSFDGQDDSLQTPPPENVFFQDFTLALWVRTPQSSSAGWETIVESSRGTSSWFGFWKSSTGNRFHFRCSNLGAFDFPDDFQPNTWYHLTAVLDRTTQPNTVMLYLDGNLVDSLTTESTSFTTLGALYAGGNSEGAEFFQGSLDDLRLYAKKLSATEILALYRQAGNLAPVAQDGILDLQEDTSPGGRLVATDPDNDELNFSIVTQPPQGKVTIADPLTGDYLFTPDPNQFGTVSFTFKASDGILDSNVATVSLLIAAVNDTPQVTDDSALSNYHTQTDIDVLQNDRDIDGDSLSIVAVTQGANGTVQNNGTSLSYLPDAGFYGTDSFTYTVSDGQGGTAMGTVSVITQLDGLVASWKFNEEDGTIAQDSSGNNNQGRIVSASRVQQARQGGALLFDGIDSYVQVEDQSSLRLTSMTLSTWVYIPAQISTGWQTILEHGRLGTNWYGLWKSNDKDSFHFRWSAAGASDFLQEILPDTWYHVVGVLDSSTYPARVSLYLNGQLDSEFYTKRLPLESPGILNLGKSAHDNEFFAGRLDEVQIYNRPLSASEVLDLYIEFANNHPQAVDDSLSVWGDMPATVDLLANDFEPDGQSISLSEFAQPDHGTATVDSDGLLTYTPTPGYYGFDALSYTISDSEGAYSSATLWINVHPSNAVASWHFDEGTGTTAADSSGNGLDANAENILWKDGRSGYALDFSPEGAKAVTAPCSPLPSRWLFAIAAWVKPSGDQNDFAGILQYRDSASSDQWGFCLEMLAPCLPQVAVNINSKITSVKATSSLAIGAWSHVAATYDGLELKLYINGSLANSTSCTGSLDSASHCLYIGYNPFDKVGFNGAIDLLQLFGECLSPDDISLLAENHPPEVSLSASAPGNDLVGGGAISLFATAQDQDGEIAALEIYHNGELLESSSSSEMNLSWTSLLSGQHTFVAVATDSQAARVESTPLVLTVGEERQGASTTLTAENYLEVPATTLLDLQDRLTIEAWINTSDISPDRQTIVGKAGAYALGLENDRLFFEVGGTLKYSSPAGLVLPQIWHHVAVAYNRWEIALFIDGLKVVDELADFLIPLTDSPVLLGQNFSGRLDEIKISGSCEYTESFTICNEPLGLSDSTLALWHFDQREGTTTYDASGNQLDAQLASSAAWDNGFQESFIRIMPLGDSITQGANTQNSYRRPLWHKLVAAGYRPDFVGSQTLNYPLTTDTPGTEPPNPDFDLNHEGHAGWRADQIVPYVSLWAQTYQPDIVLIHLGTNDLKQTIDSTILDLEAIVDILREANPRVNICLAQLIPTQNAIINTTIQELNLSIAELGLSKDSTQSPLLVVDFYSDYDAMVNNWDRLHPNSTGEEVMASRWFAAIETLLLMELEDNESE